VAGHQGASSAPSAEAVLLDTCPHRSCRSSGLVYHRPPPSHLPGPTGFTRSNTMDFDCSPRAMASGCDSIPAAAMSGEAAIR
jgi:hypothetical protein